MGLSSYIGILISLVTVRRLEKYYADEEKISNREAAADVGTSIETRARRLSELQREPRKQPGQRPIIVIRDAGAARKIEAHFQRVSAGAIIPH